MICLLLDVRPLETSAADAIDGAVRIPWPTIESGEALEQVRSLAAGKDVHVICQSGGWSAASSQFLEDQGIDVTNVAGGMNAWSLEQADVKAASISSFTADEEVDKDEPGIWFTADNGSHIYLNGEQLKFDLGNEEPAPGTWDWRQGFYRSLDDVVLKAGKNVLAIAAWDSEEIAGINGQFKFSEDVIISTSTEDGWWVYNADTRKDACIGLNNEKGCTGLYAYQVESADGENNSTLISKDFPENEAALVTLFEDAKEDGLTPDIPASNDLSGLHWTTGRLSDEKV